MSEEMPKSPRARLFIALDLPEELRRGLAEWGRAQLGDPALRAVHPEALHVTLAFLGHRPEEEVERLGKIVRGLRAAAPTLRLDDPLAKPSLRRARIFALPADSPGRCRCRRSSSESWLRRGSTKRRSARFGLM